MDPDRRDLLLRRINAKGLEVATKLSELLAGKDVRLDDFELTGDEDPRVARRSACGRTWRWSIGPGRGCSTARSAPA
ncbi:MAG: hypothetical protein H6744_10540 [Deltaproteobacteria bacterium]|nr:hypothetical protein [Deltaproteobacteria bacterium]